MDPQERFQAIGRAIDFKDSTVYEGEWKDGKEEGYGRKIYGGANKKFDYYLGFWQKGKHHGYGLMLNKNGKIDEGSWVNGEFKS